MTLRDLRRQFPHVENQTYVNHAATSPISRPVRNAIDDYLDERHGAAPDAPIDNFADFQPVLAETKERLARVLGTDAGRVEFMANTSTALNVLTRGFDWRPGDRIAVPDGEFPTNVYPFLNLESEGVAVDFIPTEDGTFTVEDVERTIRPETRLVSVSWVQFLSGFRADLSAIGDLCAARDVDFCVDAIQGLGALELDVEAAGIDFLACGGHKWMMATQGSGFLYCSEAMQEKIDPPAGWLHGPVDWENLDDYDLSFHDDATRFRIGTTNNTGIAALHASLGMYLEAGPSWCEDRILANAQRLAEGLAERGYRRYGSRDPDAASGIVTIVPEAPEALFEHLMDHDITGALRNRKLRLAPHYYNTIDEMDRVLDVVDTFDPVAA